MRHRLRPDKSKRIKRAPIATLAALALLLWLAIACSDRVPLPSTPTASPMVAEIEPRTQAEIDRLQKMGLTAVETIETSLDGENEHVAVLIRPQSERFDPDVWRNVLQFATPPAKPPHGPPSTRALLVYEVRGDKLVRIFDRLQFFVSLQQYAGVLGSVDVDADGVRELAVALGNGGNCFACVWVEIYSVRDGAVRTFSPT